MRNLVLGAIISLSISSGVAAAAGWTLYENGRFQYMLSVPPGYTTVAEAENGDGGVSTSPDGTAELRVWGSNILEGDFTTEIASQIEQDKSVGWQVSYDVRRARSASWSATRGDRVVYVRAIMGCDDAADYFRLEYDKSNLKSFDPIVTNLVKTFKSAC